MNLSSKLLENTVEAFATLPGIGKKTAERLLIELRDKVKDINQQEGGSSVLAANAYQSSIHDEAESALVALGYRPQDASKAIKNAKQDNQSLETLIKAALKSMI